MSKTITVVITELKKSLFVRASFNDNHALNLSLLVEAGVKFPPITITSDMEVIDGRHRIEAYELNGLKEIQAEVVPVNSEAELISKAYKANSGGSLPPTLADTEHTVELLLDREVLQKDIAGLLGLPASLARKFVSQVKSKVKRRKLIQAAEAITEGGLNIPKASEKYGVDPEDLKRHLRGPKGGKRGSAEIQRILSRAFKSLAMKNAAALRDLLGKYEDGDLNKKQVQDIFAHIKRLQECSKRAITDWEARFDSVSASASKEKVLVS